MRRNKLVTHASPSGLTTRRDWGTTVALFTNEYKVSLLCLVAAVSTGTVGELVLPVLLVLDRWLALRRQSPGR